jgi:hypothetical protein
MLRVYGDEVLPALELEGLSVDAKQERIMMRVTYGR